MTAVRVCPSRTTPDPRNAISRTPNSIIAAFRKMANPPRARGCAPVRRAANPWGLVRALLSGASGDISAALRVRRSVPAQRLPVGVAQIPRRGEHDVDDLPDPAAAAGHELDDAEPRLTEQEAIDAQVAREHAGDEHVGRGHARRAVDLGRPQLLAVGVPQHPEREEQRIDEPPEPEPAQREELEDAEPRLSEVEAIDAEDAEKVGEQECRAV